jgi:hypothetical protein
MEISTVELMEAIAKVKAGEQTVEEAFASFPPEEREILEVVVVEADGTLQAIEPIDYSGWRWRPPS